MRIRHVIAGVLIAYFGFNLFILGWIGLGGIVKFSWWAHAPIKGFIWALKGGWAGTSLAILVAGVILAAIVACCHTPVRARTQRNFGLESGGGEEW